jgi:hypothetical protein
VSGKLIEKMIKDQPMQVANRSMLPVTIAVICDAIRMAFGVCMAFPTFSDE